MDRLNTPNIANQVCVCMAVTDGKHAELWVLRISVENLGFDRNDAAWHKCSPRVAGAPDTRDAAQVWTPCPCARTTCSMVSIKT